MNPYDKNAIEVALSLREYYGGQVIILSMGPEENKKSIMGEFRWVQTLEFCLAQNHLQVPIL